MNKSKLNKGNEKEILSLTIWPHRSCSKGNFQLTIFLIALGLIFPSFLFYDLKFNLIILPFSLITIILLFISCEKNFNDGQLKENLKIFPKKILLQRSEPQGNIKIWSGNPIWTKVNLYNNGPVDSYLTLRENSKEVELGSFLTPKERVELKNLIEDTLFKLKIRDFSS